MGNTLATIYIGRKFEWMWPMLFWEKAGPCLTTSPWPKPSSVPSDILIQGWIKMPLGTEIGLLWTNGWSHLANNRHGPKIGRQCPFWGLGPHLTSVAGAEAYHVPSFFLIKPNVWPQHQRHRQTTVR